MKIIYKRCPSEVRKIVAPLLKKHARLVPSWVHTLTIDFEPDALSHEIAQVQPMPEYRKAYISLHASYLAGDDDDRESHFVHELLHLQIHPLVNAFRAFVNSVVEPESALETMMSEEIRVKMEGTVEDLRRMVMLD